MQDYHCHLTTSEVVGYLAGKFDPQSHRKCTSRIPTFCAIPEFNIHHLESWKVIRNFQGGEGGGDLKSLIHVSEVF